MSFTWKQRERPPVTDARTDHRLSHLAHLAQMHEALWHSVLIRLEDTSIDGFLASLPTGLAPMVHVPALYDAGERSETLPVHYVSAFARGPALAALNADDNPHGVTALRLGQPVEGGIEQEAPFVPLPDLEGADDTVVMAVIDDAIALGHNLFASGCAQTRIASALVMSAAPDTAAGSTRGAVFGKAELDGFLAQCTRSGLLDEERFYERTGQISRATPGGGQIAHRRTHGTHVAALAAGFPRERAPQNRPMLCVCLPEAVTWDVTGRSILPDLAYALKFISKQGRQIKAGKRPAPLVCNFSYGAYGGPHDGTGDVAQLLESFVTKSKRQTRRVTLPSGNSYGKAIHAALAFDGTSGQSKTLYLDVPADDRSSGHLQFWLPVSPGPAPQGAPKLRVTLPSGQQSPEFEVRPNAVMELHNCLGQAVAQLSYSYDRKPTQRGVITLTVYPTHSLDTSVPLAPPGRWEIEMSLSQEASVNVWIDRDEDLPGHRPRGRQMRFSAEQPETVTDASTLSGFACGPSPIVVGASNGEARAVAAYTAAGPITPTVNSPDVPRPGPDVAALGEDSFVLPGIYSAGARCGSYVRLGGTSVAAPQIARFLADGLASGASADRAWVQQQAKARNPDIDRSAYPEARAGEGPINVYEPLPGGTA